jgi:hypothetical protein
MEFQASFKVYSGRYSACILPLPAWNAELILRPRSTLYPCIKLHICINESGYMYVLLYEPHNVYRVLHEVFFILFICYLVMWMLWDSSKLCMNMCVV